MPQNSTIGEKTDGLFLPSSVMWKISRERVLLAGGPSAAILQIAHPIVAHGVKNHSSFQRHPFRRLRNTLDAVYTTAFGTREQVEKTRENIARMHKPVHGEMPGGRHYSAFDADAQLWVLATLLQTSVFIYEQWVAPLSDSEKESYYHEYRIFGEIFGLDCTYGPQSWPAFCIYYEEMLHSRLLASEPICAELAQIIAHPPHPPGFSLAMQPFHFLVNEFIPSPVRERLGFHSNAWTASVFRNANRFLPKIIPQLPSSIRFCKPYRSALRRSAAYGTQLGN
ncbi:MAG: oxygenase MpaB family protein [Chthoniobacterales bacterium]